MAGYNNDTFWNWTAWETVSPDVRTDQDNPRFLTDTGPRPSYSPVLRRGFIRSAVPEKYTHRRCFFQFNPNLLTRDTANQAGALPWLQDPAQLSIPTGTAAGFGFSMFFNRDMEVMTQSVRTGASPLSDGQGIKRVVNLPDPSSGNPNAVAGIGVLADLRVLDEILGIGFYNTASIEDLKKRFPGPTSDNPIGVIPEVPFTPGATVDFNTGIGGLDPDLLRGNVVYMFQQPIRVVFSSLFIVEGYVSSMAVTFQKFNFAMVPTVCTVNLSIEALYIGVARMKTIVTEYLDTIERYKTPDAVVTIPDTPTTPVDPVGAGDDFTPSSLKISSPTDPVPPIGHKNQEYSLTFLAKGGTPPYMWDGLSIPAGLTLASSGVMSGTPTQISNDHPMTVRVKDSTGKIASRGYNFKVIL